MGTRNLVVVVSNKKTKVAQYGQFDGYPSGRGADVLEFLSSVNLEEFKKKVDKLSFYKDSEIDSLSVEEHPELHRDTSADILPLIYEGKVTKLVNREDFAGDGLFCEYCYVIDLDNRVLEVYTGSKEPLERTDRYYRYMKTISADSTYMPVKKRVSFSLDSLPKISEFIEKTEQIVGAF